MIVPVGPDRAGRVDVAIEHPDDVAAEWAELADRCAPDPFLHPDWWLAWRSSFEEPLAVATLRDATGLRALAPVVLDGRVLRLAGNVHVPWVGLLADGPQAARSLFEGLIRMRHTQLRVGPTDSDGLLVSCVRQAAARDGSRTLEHSVRRSPYVELAGVADVADLLDRRVRKDLRRRRRRLEEQGRVELTLHRGGPDLGERLAEAFAIELRQWKGRAGTAIASRPQTREFYTRVAEAAAERQDLQLAVLRVDGRAVAFALDLRHGDVLHSLKTAFDPDFAAFSPGQLLSWEVLADAARHGIVRYEFLGTDEPYKLRWTSRRHELRTVVVYPRTAAGTTAYVLRRYARPAAARARDVLVAGRSRIAGARA